MFSSNKSLGIHMVEQRRTALKCVSPRNVSGQDNRALVEQHREILATINHDLRQPLQTMELLYGVLSAQTKDKNALKILAQLEETLKAMTGIVNGLLGTDGSETTPALMNAVLTTVEDRQKPQETCPAPLPSTEPFSKATIYVIDDDKSVREGLGQLLQCHGHLVELFESCEQFMAFGDLDRNGCILIDVMLPGLNGVELLKHLEACGEHIPAVMITGSSDVSLAVQAMKAGATDFIEKPMGANDLLKIISRVLQKNQDDVAILAERDDARTRLERLSARERQIMDAVLDGHPNKNIAFELGISQRTVEVHRANIMRKLGVRSLPALLRLAMSAA
jgi:FixJ family two-component response regulator